MKPKPGERDFRGFDWRYLSRLCLDSPSEVLAMNANGYRAVDFSPDGRTVALGTKDGLVELYDAPTRRRLKSWKAHTAAIDRLAFYPKDNPWLAAVSGQDGGHLKFWNTSNETLLDSIPVAQGFPADFSFSPGGKYLVTQSTNFGSIAVWQFLTTHLDAAPQFTLRTNLDYSGPAAFSPDERTLAACNRIKREPRLVSMALHNLIDGTEAYLPTGRVLREFRGNEGLFPAQPLAVSRDGKRLATGSPEGKVLVRDIATLHLLASSPVKLGIIADRQFSPDDRQLAITQALGPIFLWEFGRPGKWRRLAGHAGSGTVLAFSPDGRTLASGGMDHLVRLWHPDIDQEVAILRGHTGWIWSLAFTKDGDGLLSGSGDGTLRLWPALSFHEIQGQETGAAD